MRYTTIKALLRGYALRIPEKGLCQSVENDLESESHPTKRTAKTS